MKTPMRTLLVAVTAVVFSSTLAAAAVTVTRGPYLQLRTDEGFTVRWRTDVPTDSRLRWGFAPDALSATIASAADTTEHELTITGAPSDTDVWYAVGNTNGDLLFDPALHFGRTAPVPGTAKPTRIWVIGDSGLPGPALDAVRDAYPGALTGARPDVWLLVGDNAYADGTDLEYQAGFFEPFAQWAPRTVAWAARGNHDDLHPGPNNDYFELFTLPMQAESGGNASGTEQYFSFDHGDIHFVSFDTYQGDLTVPSPMLDWLKADLAANDRTWTVAFTHYPPYTKGSHDSDVLWASIQVREVFVPVLEAGGVDLVLAGHSHNYERSMLLNGHTGLSTELQPSQIVDGGDGRRTGDGAYVKPAGGPVPNSGTVYVVIGSSSRLGNGSLDHPVMVHSALTLGSVVIDVDSRELNARFLTSTGATADWFTIVKDDATAAPDPASEVALRAAGNPARASSSLRFTLPAAARVRLDLVDLRGRRVRVLTDAHFEAGDHAVSWDLRDDRGETVARGSYLARLQVGGATRAVTRVQVLR